MIDPPASRQAADQSSADQAPPLAAADLATELAQARDRLDFYESFDTLIRDNVLRSGELLRQIADERERTDQKLLVMRADLDRRLSEQRSTLEDIAQGLAGLQTNLGALSERVANSLTTLQGPEPDPPIAGATPGLPVSDATAGIADRKAEPNPEPVSESDEPASAIAAEAVTIPDLAVPGVDRDPVAAISAASQAVESEAFPAQSVAPEIRTERSAAPDAKIPAKRKIDLIVHGVPKAATALSLQRHLQELSGVETVEVREYVSGVLRFQIVATELGPDDLRHWEGGDGLETVTARDNVLELKLATADGF